MRTEPPPWLASPRRSRSPGPRTPSRPAPGRCPSPGTRSSSPPRSAAPAPAATATAAGGPAARSRRWMRAAAEQIAELSASGCFDPPPSSTNRRSEPPVRVTQPAMRLHQLVQQDQHVERGEHLHQYLWRVDTGQQRVHRRPQIEQRSRFGLRLQRGEVQTAVVVENDLSVVRQTQGDLPVGAAPAPRHAPRSAPPGPWPGSEPGPWPAGPGGHPSGFPAREQIPETGIESSGRGVDLAYD